MPSFLYKACLDGITKGRINFSKDRFKTLLVTNNYTPDPKHSYRSDITGEVEANGYPPGGVPADVKVSGNKVHFDGFTLDRVTIQARGAVICKHGGSPMLDLLVAFLDFDEDVASLDGPFTLTDSVLRLET
jgi:hypothetical protein